MKFSGWKKITGEYRTTYDTTVDRHDCSARYGVKDKHGREVGHSVTVVPYDRAAHVAHNEKLQAESKAQGWGSLGCTPHPEGTKFTAWFQITRNGEDYGASQSMRPLVAQTLDDAKTEVLAHLAKHWKAQVKKWGVK